MGRTASHRAGIIAARCAAAFAILLAGCLNRATQAPERSAATEQLGVDVTAQRARVAAQNSEFSYLGLIELTADSIIAATNDPVVARNALLWKATAIPVVQRALHQPDPLLSFVDAWVLLRQMGDWFRIGGGRNDFGEHQAIAVDALEAAEADVDGRVRSELTPDDYARVRGFVRAWADDHPLDNRLLVRPPVGQAAAQAFAGVQMGGLSSLGRMQELALDAQQMAQSYLAYAPKVVLWQAELAAAEILDTTRLGPILSRVDRLAVLTAMTGLMDQVPELVAEERHAALDELGAITETSLVNLIEFASAERQTVLDQLALLVRVERAALAEDITQSLIRTLAAGREESIAVIDHALGRIAVLGAALIVLLALLQYAVLRMFLSRRERLSTNRRS